MNLNHASKIAIIGAGAVGGYYGARLAQHGHNVHFLLRSDYAHVRNHGIKIKSVSGDFVLNPTQINIYDDPKLMPKADLVLITLKTTANHLFEPLIKPLLHEHTAILTLQNGLGNEAQLARLFGPQRVLGGMAFVCINRTGPGEIHHSDHGIVKIGEFKPKSTDRANAIARLFESSGITCSVLSDLNHGRWEKLIWNVPFNGLGAALDLTTDQLIGNPDGLDRVKKLMREVIDVSSSMGVAFDEKIIDAKIKHTQTMGAYRSSMQVDRQLGRPMEIEAIIGEVVRHGHDNGVPTPALISLYDHLKQIEFANSKHYGTKMLRL